jgi:chromatin assembly factor 1 subunit B
VLILDAIFQLEHRMIFAVATLDAVFLYDTESFYPIAYVDGIHYAELTDMSWSADGNALLVSSKDGYCTLITFEANELGERVPNV